MSVISLIEPNDNVTFMVILTCQMKNGKFTLIKAICFPKYSYYPQIYIAFMEIIIDQKRLIKLSVHECLFKQPRHLFSINCIFMCLCVTKICVRLFESSRAARNSRFAVNERY